MPPDAPAPAPWTVAERGSFLLGCCETCGWTSPARRARHSVETDLRAHEVLCRSGPTEEVEAAGAVEGLDGAEVAVVEPDDVASGRERLSAQGRS
ncbi:MAG TPA: hypothetical protein VFN43_00350 [Humibacillus sp.]|nr:hypothetical protein [Humibacillus sp.]